MAQPDMTWLPAGGEMCERIRSFDWSRTAIGAADTWSPALKTTLRIMLANRFPHILWWGPHLIQFYNDPYVPIPGSKHPDIAFGQPANECWSEIWHIIGPLIARPFYGGPATWDDDIELHINRRGFMEETHFTVAYSPVPDETVSTGIGGVIGTVHEITEKVVSQRRIEILRDLASGATDIRTAEDACISASAVLSKYAKDIPFAFLYLCDDQAKSARLAASTVTYPTAELFSTHIDLTSAQDQPWPLSDVTRRHTIKVIDDLAERLGAFIPYGPWSDLPRQAIAIPIRSNKASLLAGILVAGVSSRLRLDESYLSFYELVATQIEAAIANARAYEEERKRAEALAEIDRAKTAFFSNVSHEFRTPLTLMLGPLEEMLNESAMESDREKKRDLETVHRNSLRLLRLVNTMLDFSRIEAGRARANYRPTDISRLTTELASSFRSACERAGLQLDVVCEQIAPSEGVYVDRDMWEKIVLNLISNAFKFTLEGRIEIRVDTHDNKARLTVSDTGVGIPPDELPRMFERFHRVPQTQGRTHEGSGIGLALVQELVKLHGGEVRVESCIGKGSRFIVDIPLGRSHLNPDHINTTTGLGSTATGAAAFVEEALRWLPEASEGVEELAQAARLIKPALPLKDRPRVIWADDNGDMRSYVARLLRDRCDVEVYADGEAALEAALRNPPDLVLSDIMMPKLDGFGLLHALRVHPATADTAIILVSARAGEESRVEGLEAGADDYIIKPFSAAELIARVESHAKMTRMRRKSNSALRRRTEQFETLVKRAPIGVCLVDANLRIREVNPVALPFFGELAANVIGQDFDEVMHVLWHKEPADELVRRFKETLETGDPCFIAEQAEQQIDCGELAHYEWQIDRIVLPEGGYGVVCYFRDISAQIQARRTEHLLVQELNHRIKNTFASVQAIVQQTLRNTRNPADFVASVSGRIQSMARMHTLLSNAAWKGVDLAEVIRDQLLFGPIDEKRFTSSGPSVLLEPQLALHLALMLHELGTNSKRHGALSVPKGHVSITWVTEGTRLVLRWKEQGGPPVATPVTRGFGTMLIESSAKGNGGFAGMFCTAEGVTWEIILPLAHSTGTQHASSAASTRGTSNAAPGAALTLSGKRFLVIEDEPVVAMDLCATLEQAGAEVVGTAGTEQDALRIIEMVNLDGALLDGNLHGEPVDQIAALLRRRDVPFLFVTGYVRENLPRGFSHAAVLAKPFSQNQLIEAASRLIQRSA